MSSTTLLYYVVRVHYQVFVFITNGVSLDVTQTRYIAAYARSEGWNVVGVFVGDRFREPGRTAYQEVVQISSNRQITDQLLVTSFDNLAAKVDTFVAATSPHLYPIAG